MADNNHVLQLTAAQLDETLRKVPELDETVGRLSEEIANIVDDIYERLECRLPLGLVRGWHNYSTGEVVQDNSAGFATTEYFDLDVVREVYCENGYAYRPFYYDANKTFVNYGGERAPNGKYAEEVPSNANVKYVKFTIYKQGNGAISKAEAENNFIVYRKTKFDLIGNWIEGKIVLYSDGTLSDSASYSVTDFIRLPKSMDTTFMFHKNIMAGGNAGVCFYDENKTFVHGTRTNSTNSTSSTKFPENSAYVRISTLNDYKDEVEAFVFINLKKELNENIAFCASIADTLTEENADWGV